MLQGEFDPQTSPEHAERVALAYELPNQRLVRVPYAVHCSASEPGLSRMVGTEEECSPLIAASFFASGGRTVDVDCLSLLAPPDFEGSENTTRRASFRYFGTDNLW